MGQKVFNTNVCRLTMKVPEPIGFYWYYEFTSLIECMWMVTRLIPLFSYHSLNSKLKYLT